MTRYTHFLPCLPTRRAPMIPLGGIILFATWKRNRASMGKKLNYVPGEPSEYASAPRHSYNLKSRPQSIVRRSVVDIRGRYPLCAQTGCTKTGDFSAGGTLCNLWRTGSIAHIYGTPITSPDWHDGSLKQAVFAQRHIQKPRRIHRHTHL